MRCPDSAWNVKPSSHDSTYVYQMKDDCGADNADNTEILEEMAAGGDSEDRGCRTVTVYAPVPAERPFRQHERHTQAK